MRHWNQLQPGGQGSAADFVLYFKNLLGANKEVCGQHFNNTHQSTNVMKALQKGDVCRARGNGKFH
jgi:hypothetical protein